MRLEIASFIDGDYESLSYRVIRSSFLDAWNGAYRSWAEIVFRDPVNIKVGENRTGLPPKLAQIEQVRNPDLFLVELTKGVELGGVEITDHSFDGSNADKRYPLLWMARRIGVNAFLACRYLKARPGGQTNRLPHRHAKRNSQLLSEWKPRDLPASQLCQTLPIRELHIGDLRKVSHQIRKHMPGWAEIGAYFAHALALDVLPREARDRAAAWRETFYRDLRSLHDACMSETRDVQQSTLIKLPEMWAQVYNARPDSGHWERGEGQFDSIDGRLMFTLDEIQFMPIAERPRRLEFWLPQLAGGHPWIREQRERGFNSKRLRNILVLLAKECPTKFAEDLSPEDWKVLVANPSLTLERLDWDPRVYRVVDVLAGRSAERLARRGIERQSADLHAAIVALLLNPNLYFSSHRGYVSGWQADLVNAVSRLSASATVLVPRIPRTLLPREVNSSPAMVVCAEDCTKEQLLMLRQLHRRR